MVAWWTSRSIRAAATMASPRISAPLLEAAVGGDDDRAAFAAERKDPDPPAVRRLRGQATDIEIQAREVINVKRRLEEIIAKHTGQPLERVSKDMERDYFMTSEEAREYGIIDHVIRRSRR
jgi:ATP-dependent Clp endopeptidase proteolytic subunit ClpP